MLKSAYAPFGPLALALAAATAVMGGPASSEPARTPVPSPGPTSVVQYRDLDLTTDAGRMELQHRVNLAAWKACQEGANDAYSHAIRGRCEAAAAASAAEMQRRVIANATARTYAGAARAPVAFSTGNSVAVSAPNR
jgi:UrcA family protein